MKNKIKIMYVMTSCRKCGPTQQTLNIIKNLDRNVFDPVLVTIYEESGESRLKDFLPYVTKHYKVLMSKKSIILGRNKKMRDFLLSQNPDIIHSVGVFPDYLISSIGFKKHIFTLRNFIYDDYPDKYGKIRGHILARMQIKAIGRANTVVTCSKSLQKIYDEKLGIKTECIQNGVSIKKYSSISKIEKDKRRKKLGLSTDDFVWVYSGQFIGRKNIPFMIDGFLKVCKNNDKLLLLGDGDDFDKIKEKYKNKNNLLFMGNVNDVAYYLGVGDVYVSASKSEGLPNSVLEAMSCGLPVLLSDIQQHKELLINGVESGGVTFALNNASDYMKKMNAMRRADTILVGRKARENVLANFSARKLSQKYQELYKGTIFIKRITLFISSLSGGGAERVTANLANYLSEKGYKIDVITMSNKNDTYVLDEGIRRICLLDEKERSSRLRNLLIRNRRLKRYVRDSKDVSCYVVMLPITIFILARLKRLTRAKIVISERIVPKSHSILKKMMMKYSVRRSDGLVVQTKEIGDYYKFAKDKIIIPNAINKDIEISKRDLVEKKIVAVGRLEKQKNYSMLIKGFLLFSAKHPEYELEIYGQGSEEGSLRRLVDKYGLSNSVKFMGYTKNVDKEILSATCFVMTSNYEGMPNALIEAMCMGLPCLVTDSDGGGARALIDNFKNGILIQKGAIDDLVKNLEKIVNDKVFSDKISRNAKKIRLALAPDKIYGAWEDYIIKVVSRS